MRKKHPDYHQLDQEVKKKVLDVVSFFYEMRHFGAQSVILM